MVCVALLRHSHRAGGGNGRFGGAVGLFGAVHGLIGEPQSVAQASPGGQVMAVDDTDRGLDRHGLPVDEHGFDQRVMQVDHLRVAGRPVAQAGRHGGVLVATVAHEHRVAVGDAEQRAQPVGDLCEGLVTGVVPVGVVELLEVVEVDQQHRGVGPPAQQSLRRRGPGGAVWQAGDQVVLGEGEPAA